MTNNHKPKIEMNSVQQRAEDHGEIPMTMSQFEEEERRAEEQRLERGKERYTLELTADELDWLLFEIMSHAAVEARRQGFGSKELDIRHAMNEWLEQVSEQGYESF